MADLAEIYETTRKELADFVAGLSKKDLTRAVPATPEWSIEDVIAHVTGAAERLAARDFPSEYFFANGTEHGVAALNEWTERHVSDRRGRPLQDVLNEWETVTVTIAPMLRGDVPWGDEVIPFGGHVNVADLATHQHDIYGAMGVEMERESVAVRIGFATFVGGVDLRVRASGSPALRFVNEHKEIVAGYGDPVATVTASRFELFRALSGRRNPEQVRGYDWEGDPEPFLKYFYPYGERKDALVEEGVPAET